MSIQAYAPEFLGAIRAALDPGEEIVEICDFAAIGTGISRTAVLSNRYVRFFGFRQSFFGMRPEIVASSMVPLHKVSSMATAKGKAGIFGPKVFELHFWWEGTREALVTTMLEAGESLADKLKALTAGPGKLIPPVSVAEEIRQLAELEREGILSKEELLRAKELFLGKPIDKQEESVRLLRSLHYLKVQGVLSQSEFNAKKWEILSKRHMA